MITRIMHRVVNKTYLRENKMAFVTELETGLRIKLIFFTSEKCYFCSINITGA